MSDWTASERRIKTPYGFIYYGGPCRDRYPNFRRYDPEGTGLTVTLQGPALRALKAAQVRYAKRTGWTKARLDKHPEGRVITLLAGTNRACSTQAALYRSDPNRYADPKYTGHCRGLALDVSQAQPNLKIIYSCLALEGWKRARSDEPWHHSFHVSI